VLLLIGGEFCVVVFGRGEHGDAALGVASSNRGANRAVRGRDGNIDLVKDRVGGNRVGVRGAGESGQHARIRGQAVGVNDAQELGRSWVAATAAARAKK
jgi:hypothetical protein